MLLQGLLEAIRVFQVKQLFKHCWLLDLLFLDHLIFSFSLLLILLLLLSCLHGLLLLLFEGSLERMAGLSQLALLVVVLSYTLAVHPGQITWEIGVISGLEAVLVALEDPLALAVEV